jgi:two-component system, LuxR family, response regulator FixJ
MPAMSTSAVVHVIDDDEAVRHSLAFVLATAGLAVRVYESGSAFLAALDNLQPGCIVSDVRMPGIDGLQLLRKLRDLGVDLPVIIITGHADVPLAVEAMKAGAADFIEKPFDDEVLLRAIRAALESYAAASDRDAERVEIRAKLDHLSPREREVLDGLLAGYPNKTIAYDLKLSPRTVEVHRANIMAKMGATSLSSLVRMALMAKVLPAG